MSALRKRYTAALAVPIAVALTFALAGCVGGNPIEGIIEGVTGGQVELGGNSVPDGFPSEVPLIDGEVILGVAFDGETGKAFNVTIKVPDARSSEIIASQFYDAGFTENLDLGESTAAYSNGSWDVLVAFTQDATNGFIANYTVTEALVQ